MKTFLRNNMEWYIVSMSNDEVTYGLHIPGHENKTATGIMTREYFDKLLSKKIIVLP